MKRRGAYFFVLDALIGGAIFLISVVLIMGSYLNTPDTKQTYIIAEDVMNILLSTKIIDFRDPYISELEKRGYVTNQEQTIFEQISELYYKGRINESHNLTRNIINSLVPEQYGASYSIYNSTSETETILFNRSLERINNSRFLLSSRKITFYSINQTKFFGPDLTELRIWS